MRLWIVCFCVIFAFAQAGADDGKITVGVVLPLTGETSNFGIEALKGINLAVDAINERGGVKDKQLHIVVKDNAGDPANTSREVTVLIREENVLAIIGPITSTNSAAAAAVAQQNQTPLILPTATSPYVTEIGNYISRICFTDPLQSKALAEFARKSLKSEKVAIIRETGSSYSEVLAEFFARRFKKMGGMVTSMRGFGSAREELAQLLDKVLAEGPDLVFAPVYYPEGIIVLDHLSKVGSSVTVLGGDGWESPELFRSVGDKITPGHLYIGSHFSPQLQTEVVAHFVERFERAYDSSPNALSALNFDAVGVLANAVKRATVISRDGVQQALVTTVEYPGVTGRITLNEKRNVIKDVYILKALKDDFVYEGVVSGL